MAKYRCLAGSGSLWTTGKEGNRTRVEFDKGDIVETDDDLVGKHGSEKFERVSDSTPLKKSAPDILTKVPKLSSIPGEF